MVPRLLKLCQSGEISPNLVTLIGGLFQYLGKRTKITLILGAGSRCTSLTKVFTNGIFSFCVCRGVTLLAAFESEKLVKAS